MRNAAHRAFERQLSDTPERRRLEREISALLHELDALEGTSPNGAPNAYELAAERARVATDLETTIASLRALRRDA